MKNSGVKIILSVIVLVLGLGTGPCECRPLAGYFEWEPFRTDPFLLQPPKGEGLLPALSESEFRDADRYQFYVNGSSELKDDPDRPEALEFDFRRFKFSISRYAFNPDRDHSIRKSDLDRERERLIQSLPSTLQSSSFQDKFESIGKIFEPNVNLRIEF